MEEDEEYYDEEEEEAYFVLVDFLIIENNNPYTEDIIRAYKDLKSLTEDDYIFSTEMIRGEYNYYRKNHQDCDMPFDVYAYELFCQIA